MYRPNSYAVRVRSLSDLVEEGEKESAEGTEKSKQVIRTRLKKQSAFNLLSMFSSPGVRRAELAAILKLEDTGETLGGKPSTEIYSAEADAKEGWRTEDFPLPKISEESGVSSESRKSSAKSPSTISPVASPDKRRSPVISPVKSHEEDKPLSG